jgi:hypothetical protein
MDVQQAEVDTHCGDELERVARRAGPANLQPDPVVAVAPVA